MIEKLPPDVLVQVLDALPVRIFWKDRDSCFLGCNRLFAEDAGLEPSDFVGKSDFYFFSPEQAAAFREDDLNVMLTGQPKLGIEEKLTQTNGETTWLETNKIPMRDASGEVTGIIGTYHVITDRKLAEVARLKAKALSAA